MAEALTAFQQFKATIERPEMMEEFRKALPQNVTVEKFVRIVVTSVLNSPISAKLLEANRPSLFLACMRAAQDGLMPDGQEAALVTYGDKVAYMPMVKGILKKVRNSGELSSISAQIIHEKDPFRYWVDVAGEHIEHSPNMMASLADRGPMVGVYAVAKTKDGGIYIEVMNKEQVLATKKAGRAGDNGPWKGDFEGEMWKKAVLRRISKRLPMSTDLESVIQAEDEQFNFDDDKDPVKVAPATSSRLASVVSQVQTEAPPSPVQAPAAAAVPAQAAVSDKDTPI